MEIKINTEFNIGDKIYYYNIYEHKIVKTQICDINITSIVKKEYLYVIKYKGGTNHTINMWVTKTKEELKERILQNYKKEFVDKLE